MKTNTAASPVMDSHPQEISRRIFRCFRHTSRDTNYIWIQSCRSLWFIDLPWRGIRDNTSPSASHGFMTRLTVDSQVATVIAVDHSRSFSPGGLCWIVGRLLRPVVGYSEIMWMEWFGMNDGHIAASLEIIGKKRENKNPAGYWSGRGSRKNR